MSWILLWAEVAASALSMVDVMRLWRYVITLSPKELFPCHACVMFFSGLCRTWDKTSRIGTAFRRVKEFSHHLASGSSTWTLSTLALSKFLSERFTEFLRRPLPSKMTNTVTLLAGPDRSADDDDPPPEMTKDDDDPPPESKGA